MCQSTIYGLSSNEWIKIGCCWKHGVLQSELPKLSGISKQSLIKSIKSLLIWNKIYRKRIRLNTKRSWTYVIFPIDNT